MAYLAEAEIPVYCGLASGVTMDHIEAASVMIDAFKGCSFERTPRKEKINLTFKRSSGLLRGKLKHFPLIAVNTVTAKVRSPFGDAMLEYDADAFDFDGDESAYFTFVVPRSLLLHMPPKAITVEYESGYDPVPETVKRACGLLAGNIKQMGGMLQWKSRDDYDIKVTLGNEGVFSSSIQSILQGVPVG